MKKQGKSKVNAIISQCIASFLTWDKKSTSVFNILEQISGLKKSKWELFELSDDVKKKVEENLKIRLYEELYLLSREISVLESHLQEMEHRRSSLQSRVSDVRRPQSASLECFYVLNDMCSLLRLIIDMKQVPMRRISLSDKDSFQFLKDSNASILNVIKQFKGKVESWKEFIADI